MANISILKMTKYPEKNWLKSSSLFIYSTLGCLSIFVFLYGFFPIPNRSKVLSNIPRNNINSSFDRVVFIVIDALRLDFVTADKVPFLWRSYQNNGCFNELNVENPTVTLPRIKALTTGNVPQFIDIILNLANPTALDDSLVHRARADNKTIVFYGDDIWPRLFSEEFTRNEGVCSFFVNDYTEVDDNVTRNVRKELKKNDWDLMILHYLGLDHIGHVFGPKSPLILSKLKEMDDIIEEIYTSNQNTLLIVTGDHGMRDSGGHGGSTFPETHVPLIVVGIPCINSSFAQIDIPVNLAILLNLEIPGTSIGLLQSNLLQHLSGKDLLNSLRYNTVFLNDKLPLCSDDIDAGDYFRDLYGLKQDEVSLGKSSELYINCSRRISEKLLETSIHQNVPALIFSSLVGIYILIFFLNTSIVNISEIVHQTLISIILIAQFWGLSLLVTMFLAILVISLYVLTLKTITVSYFEVKFTFWSLMSFIHPFIFLSSSFLEEEHQFWYFFFGTFLLFEYLKSHKFRWILLFTMLRFVRTLNQVGDKWAASPDLADWFLDEQNRVYLQVFFITSLVLTYFSLSERDHFPKCNLLSFIFFGLIFLYRFPTNQDVILGKVLWGLIIIKFIAVKVNRAHFSDVWVFIITLLLKPHNVILIPFCILSNRFLKKTLRGTDLILGHWWLANLLFFLQGHDNSLASVDISSGYIGLSAYNPLFVFPQVLCHTYAFHTLSILLLSQTEMQGNKFFQIFAMTRLYTTFFVFAVTFIHRHHLFIWSVFAPKMFVEASHFGFLYIQIVFYYLNSAYNKLT